MSEEICAKCGNDTVTVIDSRVMMNNWRRRRRKCKNCGVHWSTIEVPQEVICSIKNIIVSARRMEQASKLLLRGIEEMPALTDFEGK